MVGVKKYRGYLEAPQPRCGQQHQITTQYSLAPQGSPHKLLILRLILSKIMALSSRNLAHLCSLASLGVQMSGFYFGTAFQCLNGSQILSASMFAYSLRRAKFSDDITKIGEINYPELIAIIFRSVELVMPASWIACRHNIDV